MAAKGDSVGMAPRRSVISIASVWVLMIPLLVFASQWGFSFEHAAQNTELGSRSQAASNGGILLKMQSAVVYMICGLCVARSWSSVSTLFRRDTLISGLLILATLSVFWSQFPATTLVHVVLLGLNIAFAYYLLDRFTTDELLKLLMMAGSLAAIGGILLILVFPQYGIQERSLITSGSWQGIFPQKNIAGFMLTLLMMPAFFVPAASRSQRIRRLGYIVALTLMIGMSRSAGACVICLACTIFALALRYLVRIPSKDLAALVLMCATLTTLTGVLVLRNFDAIMYMIGKEPTLTGRTIIWSSLWTSIEKHPLLGYGYTAFWDTERGESINTQLLMHMPMGYAENGVLELWLELGAVGVFLYCLVYFRAIRDALCCFRFGPSRAVLWYVSILFFLFVSNIEAGKVLATSDLELILSFIAFAGLQREVRARRARASDHLFDQMHGISYAEIPCHKSHASSSLPRVSQS